MNYLSRFYFRGNYLYRILVKHTRTTSSLVDLKSPIHKEPMQDNYLEIKINKNIINKLEKLSLINFDNDKDISKLKYAIYFAQKLKDLQIDFSTEPIYSVLENEKLVLRKDEVFEGNCRNQVLINAKVIEDEYFISPSNNETNL